jgi:uroporphyrin-III C-methyltransferase
MSVAIVGAGPGDPKLITVRGLELVQHCEVLVYDRLVSPQLVSEAINAVRVSRDGLTQHEVNAALVHHGRRGRRVVRLKGGDPFVFGRGGEEVEALVSAGIPYEVVPGLSTLTAIPALAGIPLTHRETASRVTVLTGTNAAGSELDYAHLAATPGTLVIFMGLRRLATIADNLILAGRRVDEGAAAVSRLSLGDACVRTGTLGTIARIAAGMDTPSVVIVGDVALHRSRLRSLAAATAQAISRQ